ncbi:MAG: oligosaccharide flippase family protein [Clostridia bacterium]|nr:oligosaccharide flippase family protein [Clostridia bacterium]MDY6184672.1 oligosaccharide flippase family protein [Eubacteriales bacterium]
MSKRMREFIKNGCFLSVAALVMRTVAVSYHAYLAESIGAEGMGLFALVNSLYGFAVTFATSGIQLAVTRLVSECLGRGEPNAARGALRRATLYALIFSGVGSLVLLVGADFFGRVVLRDARTVLSIRLQALTLVPVALSVVMSGYFTAVRRVLGNSLTQMAEQGMRIFCTVYLLGLCLPRGMTYTCAAVVGGAAIAQFLSCGALAVQYLIDRRRHVWGKGGSTEGLTPRLLHIALPVAFSAYIRSGLLTVEHLLIPRALTRGGRSMEEALASYGVLDGMALPVVFYPMAVLTSFAGLLIPVFAEHRARGEQTRIDRIASRTLHLTTVFAIGCMTVLFVFAGDFGMALYHSEETGALIRLLAPVVPLMFLDHVTDCALKGLGEQVYTMWVNIGDSLISILLVLLILPSQGAVGYVYVIEIAEALNFAFSLARLVRVTRIRYSFLKSWVFPLLTAVVTAFGVRSLLRLDPMTVGVFWLMLEVVFAFAVYFGLLALLSGTRHILHRSEDTALDIL